MSFQDAFNLAMGTCGVLGLFILKMIFDRIADAKTKADDAQASLDAHKLYAAETFLKVTRFESFEERLFEELRGLRIRLEEKMDRGHG